MQSTDISIIQEQSEVNRSEFYRNTYLHVGYALLAFMGLEALLIKVVPEATILGMMQSKMLWMGLLVGFWLLSNMATRFTFSPDRNMQYFGLGIYVIAEAVIFLPLIYAAIIFSGGNLSLISQAGIITLALFGGLSYYALTTKTDFSFLRSFIIIASFIALGLIVAGMIFGFNLGLWFSVGMVLVAAASILYQTSQLKYQYSADQYVGASLQLFASVMLLFWYVLRILMSRRS